MKRLVGRADMEDALKRLDKLTQEEARMVVAENLKVTRTVDERVKRTANTMTVMVNRVAGMDGRVASVNARVASGNDRVKVVDEKVGEVTVFTVSKSFQPVPVSAAGERQRRLLCDTDGGSFGGGAFSDSQDSLGQRCTP